MQETSGGSIDQILDKFLTASQEIYTEAESLGLTLESIEVVVIPIERRCFVRVKEFQTNSLQSHFKECDLRMQEVKFDEHVRRTAPTGISSRFLNTRALTPEIIEKTLEKEGGEWQEQK